MIVAPAHTPKPIVDRLYAELKAIAAMPEIQKQMIGLGTIPIESPAPDAQQEFRVFRDRALAQGGDARRYRRHAIGKMKSRSRPHMALSRHAAMSAQRSL